MWRGLIQVRPDASILGPMRALGTIAATATMAIAVGFIAGCGGQGAHTTGVATVDPCAQAVRAFITARGSGAPTLDPAADSLAACPGREEWSAAYRAARAAATELPEGTVITALTAACVAADPERITTTCTGLGPG